MQTPCNVEKKERQMFNITLKPKRVGFYSSAAKFGLRHAVKKSAHQNTGNLRLIFIGIMQELVISIQNVAYRCNGPIQLKSNFFKGLFLIFGD